MMLDRLVESESHTAENKRRNGFLVSTLFLVTMMFGGAMLYSLFAKPLGMMDGDLELSSIVAPVPEAEPPAEIPKPERNNNTAKTNDTPTRIINQQAIDELPMTPPKEISAAKNQFASRPAGEFKIGKVDSVGVYSSDNSREGSGNGGGVQLKTERPIVDPEEVEPPKMTPKVETPQPPKPAARVSLGVANGKAVELPKPIYPAPAKAVNAQGAVNVQVMIDEQGKVTSATAVSGHPLLRQAAEQAARRAVFSPTKLSNVPVKASGIIVYNFVSQ